MKIGEKIKKLRTDKLMTQSELVGAEITRNMLSRIENGAANPSLETILYIAGRLNVSPGYLLAEEGDEKLYVKYNEINNIKAAFMTEDYQICRDMCLNAESANDDEIQMILSECNLAIAIEAFNSGNLRIACACLDDAIESCGNTLYRTEAIVATAGVYFRYMHRFSATLSSNVIDEGEINVYPALTDAFCRYVIALERLDRNESPWDALFPEQAGNESPFSLHVEAKRLMQDQKYADAYERLHTVLLSDFPVPEPILYYIFCDLEVCCREIQDFKGAYEYSIDKIELLQKLLS